MVEGSNKIKAIGGYFELADREKEGNYPVDGVRLNTSRNALEYILRSIHGVRHIYLPFFTCKAVIQPFKRLPNIEYSFYHINENFEIADNRQLQKGEYLIANNYFGIKDSYIAELANKYGSRLIVDNAQALFASALPGIKSIYSARKFVGVADGGFAVGVGHSDAINYPSDNASKHDSHLLIRKEYGAEAGYKDFLQNECKLDNQQIRRMASRTEDILRHIDYKELIARRRANYEILQNALFVKNQLRLPEMDSFICPMVYPYLVENGIELRKRLIDNKIFIARYWPNVQEWCKENDIEYIFANNVLPLPCDQRYGEEDMKRIIELICK